MLAAIRMTCSLLKLRIGVAVAASALAGMAAAKGPAISVAQASALALAVLGASGAAGAFNHYYERDLDREMRRTRSRPFASGAFQTSLWWRSEEHTSELQSHSDIVCRLLLEKKKEKTSR